jgi:hypothetical protein
VFICQGPRAEQFQDLEALFSIFRPSPHLPFLYILLLPFYQHECSIHYRYFLSNLPIMGGLITQLFPPNPTFTERNIPSLVGKVFIVTSGNAGVGFEIVKILYSRSSTVYVASRSAVKIATEIESINSI